MNPIEERERLQEIDKVLQRYPVPTKYEALQRANERKAARILSMTIAVVIILVAAWFLWK